ncbi:MAG TPA: OmpA family protein [Flavobacteriales bacterium]|nr:OmpA family protein [Flavobacteriales bacterium]HRO40023.1 OmpA family protein [Flavobacteriales bacterium]HRP81682.1 OmpA family protein [Flavobacteriales bacterium]
MRARPFSIILCLLLPWAAFPQDGLLRQADRLYADYSYHEAIELYEQAFRKDASSIEHARRLADCYWTLRDAANAERWYAVVAASSEATGEDMYRYAELLRTSGQYADSDIWLKRFGKLAPDDSRARLKENSVEQVAAIMEKEGISHKVDPVNINGAYSEIAPFIKDRTLYFASNRPEKLSVKHVHSLNGMPFLDLFQGRVDKDGNVENVVPMADGINTSFHESNAIISADGRELYFTRNNVNAGRSVTSKDGVNNLQIIVRERTAEGWGRERPFAYNNPAYSVGHPAMTPDGRRLYFATDKPGGLGGKDIWYCDREGLGTPWSEPVNAGPEVNTEGDELFPFVHGNTLFFASDGHLGLGGLDLFQSAIRGNGHGISENVGAPVNSAADDFGLCLDEQGGLGMFSSDRGGALGAENLYFFHMHSKPEEKRKWAGRVLDIADGKPVPFLPVRLLNRERKEIARTTTSEQGTYEVQAPSEAASVSISVSGGPQAELEYDEITIAPYSDTELPDIYLNSVMDLPVNAIIRDAATDEWLAGVDVSIRNKHTGTLLFTGTTDAMGITRGQIPYQRYGDDVSYEVKFTKPGYLSRTVDVDFRVLMFLEQALMGPEGTSLSPVTTGLDMAKAMNLRPIYFDYREAKIRPDAAIELDQVAEMMLTNPSLTIDLRSHTDSRASTAYNDALSQRRAESSRQYLIGKGISQGRITCKGYGERQLVNRCADGVECSEEEHQMNRRTEFIITSCTGCTPSTAAGRP